MAPEPGPRRGLAGGVGLALVSATAFGLSGSLARGLLDSGWSAVAAVAARTGLAAIVLVPLGARALTGRWSLLRQRRNLVTICVYGVMAVAGTQLCFFYAVTHLPVGVALLIEYTAPVAVVTWMWVRHRERPHAMTLIGAGIAAVGLVLVLQILGGVHLEVVGVLWALGAMAGVAFYFVMSADAHSDLPATVLAGGGLLVGTLALGLVGASGLLSMEATTEAVALAGAELPWWVPVLMLGLVTAALAYVTGIAASRRLGARLTSFVGLSEVVVAILFAWVLLDELPRPIQLLGGVLILTGVIVVKVGEDRISQGHRPQLAWTARVRRRPGG